MLIKLLLGVLHIAALSLLPSNIYVSMLNPRFRATRFPQNEALINEVEKQLNDVNVTDGDAKFDRFVFFYWTLGDGISYFPKELKWIFERVQNKMNVIKVNP